MELSKKTQKEIEKIDDNPLATRVYHQILNAFVSAENMLI